MGMTKSQLDHLDTLAEAVRAGHNDALTGLSTGERVYAALAANRMDLAPWGDYSIVEAIARLGWDDTRALVERWQHRGSEAEGEAAQNISADEMDVDIYFPIVHDYGDRPSDGLGDRPPVTNAGAIYALDCTDEFELKLIGQSTLSELVDKAIEGHTDVYQGGLTADSVSIFERLRDALLSEANKIDALVRR
jgi:hypothetical protein